MKGFFVSTIMSVVLITLCTGPTVAQISWYSYAGNPVLHQAIEPAVIFDSAKQVYRMWFIQLGTGVWDAESPDGLSWFVGDSAVLMPGPAGAFDQYVHSVSVVKTAGTYIMYYSASTDAQVQSIGRAVSQDGKRWQKYPNSPVLTPGDSGTWDSRSVSGAKLVELEDGIYKMWFNGYNGINLGTGLATSTDGIVWTKDPGNPVLAHGESGSFDGIGADVMAVAKRDSLYYMIYRSTDDSGVLAFALATSLDGVKWWKYPGNPVKRLGSNWDQYSIGSGTLIWINGRFYLWYCGSDGDHWGVGVAMDEYVPLVIKATDGRGPTTYELKQNFPNPFNPSTTSRYALPRSSKVAVFNTLGQQVATLIEGEQEADYHEVKFDGTKFASGVHFYRIQAGSFVQTKELLLLRQGLLNHMKDQPARCTYNRAFAFDVLVKDLWSRFDPGWRIRVPGEMNEPSQRIRRYFGRAGEKLTVSRKIR